MGPCFWANGEITLAPMEFVIGQNGRRGWQRRGNTTDNRSLPEMTQLPRIGETVRAISKAQTKAQISSERNSARGAGRSLGKESRTHELLKDSLSMVKNSSYGYAQGRHHRTENPKETVEMTRLVMAPEMAQPANPKGSKSWVSASAVSASAPLPPDVASMLTIRGQMVRMMYNKSNIGPRVKRFPEPKTNQDRSTMMYPFGGNKHQALFLVADGHGDKGEFASEAATRWLVNCLNMDPRMADVSQSSDENIEAAFTEAFEGANTKLHHSKELCAPHSSGGTTMLVAVVNKDTVWVAWAGDSRAVMGSMSSTLELSRDHTCALQSEWE